MGDLRKQLQQKETVYEKEKGAFESIFLAAQLARVWHSKFNSRNVAPHDALLAKMIS